MAKKTDKPWRDTHANSESRGDEHHTNVVDLRYIIGAPLEAVIEADFLSARKFAHYLRRFGFTKNNPPAEGDPGSGSTDDYGGLQMISFSVPQRNDRGELENVIIRIPKISMVPLPLLHVKDAEFEFNVRILEAEDKTIKHGQVAALDQEHIFPREKALIEDVGMPDRYKWPAMLTPQPQREGEERVSQGLDANMRIKISMGQSDIPEGLSKLFNLLGESVNASVPGQGALVRPQSLFPQENEGESGKFSAVYNLPPDQEPVQLQFLVSDQIDSYTNAVFLSYDTDNQEVTLYADDGKTPMSGKAGQAKILQNSQAILDLAVVLFTAEGGQGMLEFTLEFKPEFVGRRKVYLCVAGLKNVVPEWFEFGTFDVTFKVNSSD